MKRRWGRPVSLSYEQAKEMARHADPAVRRLVAARKDIRPEILYYLAEDPEPQVRRQIAVNKAAPRQADLLLARDQDVDVRTGLADKIARLVPELSAGQQDRIHQMTYEALEVLARDQVTRVRQVLAEILKDVADAPPDVIRRLARDAELVVAGPVLEFSPVLTDEDLLDIIASPSVQGAVAAISRRTQVTPRVCDAISICGDEDAVASLLANPSAQIREETLDRLIDAAPGHASWHEPLVRRPRLSAGAATRLARFVADNLVSALLAREDLDPQTAETVRQEAVRRLEESPAANGNAAQPPEGEAKEEQEEQEEEEDPETEAQRLADAGELDSQVVLDALDGQRVDFVYAALAVLTGIPRSLVRRIVQTQSPKGITALAWRAGLDAHVAESLQRRLAGIKPSLIMRPAADGGWAMSEEDMNWQLELFGTFKAS